MSDATLRVRTGRNDYNFNPGISPPEKVGEFSMERCEDGWSFEYDSRWVRVLKLPDSLDTVSFDLKQNYVPLEDGGELVYSHAQSEPGMKRVGEWICQNPGKVLSQSWTHSQYEQPADFMTSRGVLSTIMKSPYEKFESWCIGVTKYRGVFFMYHLVIEKALEVEKNRTDALNAVSFGGLSFEEFVTEPRELNVQCDGPTYYYCIFKTQLAGHRIMHGAEMDCVADQSRAPDPQPRDFVEIKTAEHVIPQRRLKWWIQSYLTGVVKIVAGIRSSDLIVQQINIYEVAELPHNQKWSTNVCLNFLNRFLDFVKEVVIEDDPQVIYEFSWTPGDTDVTVQKTGSTPQRYVISERVIAAFADAPSFP